MREIDSHVIILGNCCVITVPLCKLNLHIQFYFVGRMATAVRGMNTVFIVNSGNGNGTIKRDFNSNEGEDESKKIHNEKEIQL